MKTRTIFWIALTTGVVFVLGLASAASASTTHLYGSYVGTNFDFLDTQETVQSADDEPGQLWEAPALAGDNLIFSPSSFIADSANGNGGAGLGAFDDTHSTFNATIMSTSAFDIEHIMLSEGGDITLGAFPPGSGTGATGVIANMSGTVTILDAANPLDIGTIITFGGGGADFAVCLDAGSGCVTSLFLGLPSSGAFSWTGFVDIDVASIVPGATKVELQWNNQLQANSEVDTNSLIQKKAGSTGIEIVPEPGTTVLLSLGLLGFALKGRRERQ